jgi:hypothetical protein
LRSATRRAASLMQPSQMKVKSAAEVHGRSYLPVDVSIAAAAILPHHFVTIFVMLIFL